jgi:hypothetical protein
MPAKTTSAGARYHVTDIHRSVRAEGGTRGWFATCPCGWRGPQRQSYIAAAEDSSRHSAQLPEAQS